MKRVSKMKTIREILEDLIEIDPEAVGRNYFLDEAEKGINNYIKTNYIRRHK